jgi:hypothetical protein
MLLGEVGLKYLEEGRKSVANLLQEGVKPILKEVLVPQGKKKGKKRGKYSHDAVKIARMMKGA